MQENEGGGLVLLFCLWIGTGAAVHFGYFAIGAMAGVAAVVVAVVLIGARLADHIVDQTREFNRR